MFRYLIIADAQGAIAILLGMVLIPIILSVASLVLVSLPKRRERSIVALALGLTGFASGLVLLLISGPPRSTGWIDLTAFVQTPLGLLAICVSLLRLRREPIKTARDNARDVT